MTGGVGWFDSSGDGEFHVAIRGALLGAHGADVFVGAGVIESSQPRHEVLETAHKACTIMRGLDLPQQLQPRVAPPTELEEHYVRRGYWQDETLDQFLRTRARRYRDNLAAVGHSIVTGREESWTYQQLDAATNQVAHRLHAAGVSAGDRVVVQLPNVMEYLATIFGLWRLGALPVFALPAHGATELAQFVMGARARFIIQAHPGAQTVAKISTRIAAAGMLPPTIVDVARWTEPHPAGALAEKAHDSRDIAFLQLSGGTTGIPKLIPRTHTDYLYSVRGSVDICAVDEATRLLVTLPAAHNFPMSSPGILGALHAGGAVVLARDASPRTSFVLIEKHGVTMASLVPPLAAAWLAQAERGRFNVTSLKTIQVGGARLSETVAQRLHGELGVTVQQVFGMAEGLVCYTRLDDPLELQLSTQGRPISPDDEIRIVGPNDQPVPAGAEGELLTRGPYTIRSYYGVPDPHNRLFTSDGFYRTGDLVRQLPTGHLVVTGRVKDQINRGGEKIAIPEVEELLLRHPNVLDAVLIGLPDQYLGERLCAVIVWRDRAIPPRMTAHRQIREHLQRADIAAFKYPDEVLSLREFPVTGVGKNSRAELRRILAHQALNTGQSEPPAVSVGEPSDVAVPVEPPVPAGTTAQSPPYVIAHTTEPYLHPADQPQKPREHLRLPDEHPLEVRTAQ
jgi:2,3-dihydroxybenzoate-AMP ligase